MTHQIWLHAHVEEMHESDDYMAIDKDAWEQMPEQEQDYFLASFATETMNNAGGCGASVVDATEVPAEWLDEL